MTILIKGQSKTAPKEKLLLLTKMSSFFHMLIHIYFVLLKRAPFFVYHFVSHHFMSKGKKSITMMANFIGLVALV